MEAIHRALAALILSTSSIVEAATISFDNLTNLPAVIASNSLFNANGGSNLLGGLTFPDTFAVSGDQNVVSPAAGNFVVPHSGNYAGFGFQDTTITTSLLMTSVYVASTSLDAPGDGVSSLTIQAIDGSNNVLGSVSVTGLTASPVLVDTSTFGALVGIAAYKFQIDTSGLSNPRFAIDDIEVSAVPLPTSLWLLGPAICGLGFARRRAT